jgi:Flp pilus assembly protein TadG
MKALLRSLRSGKGQSIVEMALVTPLLLVALMVPADFGIAFFVANITGNAAREGARIGSESPKSGVNGGNSDDRDFTTADADAVELAVVAKLPAYLTNRSVTVKFYEDTPAGCLEVIEVTASGTYGYSLYRILQFLGVTVPASTTISRTTQMAYRYQPYSNATRCTTTTVNKPYSNV